MAGFLLVGLDDENIVAESFDLGFAVHSSEDGISRDPQRAEGTVRLLKAAVGAHAVECADDVLRANGEDHSFGVLLAGRDHTDDLACFRMLTNKISISVFDDILF